MNSHVLIAVIVAIIAVVAVLAVVYSRRRKSERLQIRFGPEYERSVKNIGDQRKAEAELEQRARRVEKLNIRPLSPGDRTRFAERWRAVQARFVDDPKSAVSEADQLITQVMQQRGYPMTDFEQRAADISVDHPQVVENYRAAHGIAERQARGQASTEDLRQALVHYRALFNELLEVRTPSEREVA